MIPRQIVLVAIPAEHRALTAASAQAAFPGVELIEVGAWSETPATVPDDARLILAGSASTPGPAFPGPLVELAPLLSGAPDRLLLTRILRDTVALHSLQQENARLAGDLKTMARRIAHDLRSPVGSIHTSADVLGEIPADDAETIRSMAEVVKQSSGEISQIIDRVSFVLWASVHPSPAGKLDLQDIFSHVLQQLEEEIATARAAITPPASWPAPKGVPAWTQAILTNYLSNALKFGGPDPALHSAARSVPDGIRLTLADTGPGVSPAKLKTLFTPFETLHTTRVQGLGLPIVERLCRLQGGHCSYEPAPTGGARFHATLPAFD